MSADLKVTLETNYDSHAHLYTVAELSVGWVDPWVGLGWVGSRFFSF